jgi:hypothetical protein
MSITYSKCVFVALVIQHEMSIRHIVIRVLPGYAILSETFLILRKTERDMIINTQGDQKVSVHLMITIQNVTSNVQSVPGKSSDTY